MRYSGVENDIDEICRYEVRRYIGNSEPARRILCFPIHERFPPVMQLAVQLENEQREYLTEYNVLDKIQTLLQNILLPLFDLCKKRLFCKSASLLWYPFLWCVADQSVLPKKAGKKYVRPPMCEKLQGSGQLSKCWIYYSFVSRSLRSHFRPQKSLR